MAKSLRSKWRRKCRAVKRERYGAKELERLKKTLGIIDNSSKTDIPMEPIVNIVNVADIKQKQRPVGDEGMKEDRKNEEEMDTEKVIRVYNQRTMRDQFGNYPVWMNKRKIKKIKKTKKTNNSKKRK